MKAFIENSTYLFVCCGILILTGIVYFNRVIYYKAASVRMLRVMANKIVNKKVKNKDNEKGMNEDNENAKSEDTEKVKRDDIEKAKKNKDKMETKSEENEKNKNKDNAKTKKNEEEFKQNIDVKSDIQILAEKMNSEKCKFISEIFLDIEHPSIFAVDPSRHIVGEVLNLLVDEFKCVDKDIICAAVAWGCTYTRTTARPWYDLNKSRVYLQLEAGCGKNAANAWYELMTCGVNRNMCSGYSAPNSPGRDGRVLERVVSRAPLMSHTAKAALMAWIVVVVRKVSGVQRTEGISEADVRDLVANLSIIITAIVEGFEGNNDLIIRLARG